MFNSITHYIAFVFNNVILRAIFSGKAYLRLCKNVRQEYGVVEYLHAIDALKASHHYLHIENCELKRNQLRDEEIKADLDNRLTATLYDARINEVILNDLKVEQAALMERYETLQWDFDAVHQDKNQFAEQLGEFRSQYEQLNMQMSEAKEQLAASVNLSQPLCTIKREWLEKQIEQLQVDCLYCFNNDEIQQKVMTFIDENRGEFNAVDIETIKLRTRILFVEDYRDFEHVERRLPFHRSLSH